MTDRAWIHQCGTINLGVWGPDAVCSGCGVVAAEVGEVQRFWLIHDSGRYNTPPTVGDALL